mmetsp:Transcript_5927/g.15758  ORF Transcript_5927/g.15758 Transcript_5927/m.15758 type:complete len:84 (+) Transcript_5927:1018-1269(+)|eukprot:775651-Pelagomonas_calceolata.AAC.3
MSLNREPLKPVPPIQQCERSSSFSAPLKTTAGCEQSTRTQYQTATGTYQSPEPQRSSFKRNTNCSRNSVSWTKQLQAYVQKPL